MILQLLRKIQMCSVVFCDDQQAGGIFVDAMNDAGTESAADPRQAFAAMIQHSVDHRAVGITGCRMHHHALGFIDDQQILILIGNIQRNVLWYRIDGFGIRQVYLQRFTAGHFIVFLQGLAVQQNVLLLGQPLCCRAGQFFQLLCQKLIQSAAFLFRRCRQKDGLHPARPPSWLFRFWAP